MCATLPEAWQATLAETAGFHDWHLLELSLRGEAALLRLRADNGKKRARLRFDGVSHLRLHGDLSGAAGDGRVQWRARPSPRRKCWRCGWGARAARMRALALLDKRSLALPARAGGGLYVGKGGTAMKKTARTPRRVHQFPVW